MRRSEERILTSHTGSLHMPADLQELLLADFRQGQPGSSALTQRLRTAVGDIVDKQVELGVDIVNDGEFPKTSWCAYAVARMSGFEQREKTSTAPKVRSAPAPSDRPLSDRERFRDYYEQASAQTMYVTPGIEQAMFDEVMKYEPAVTGPIAYTGHEVLRRDIDNLKSAAADAGVTETFMPAVAPGSVVPKIRNEHYASEEDLFAALAAALHEEYKAITDAGLILQIDDAWLPAQWEVMLTKPGWSVERYRTWAQLSIDALNAAIEGIPADRIRYHVCWGSWNSPHVSDVPLRDIIDLILQLNVQAYSIESANARHEWEFRIWEEVALPEGKILMPGVIEHTTNVVEHPNTVAERILRFTDVVGRENVIAGTDCGLRERIHPQVAWAKLQALSEGAAIASSRLWS